MTDNPRMQELLDKLLSSQATPEQVCKSCPELLPEIRKRWRQMCRVRAELDALRATRMFRTLQPARRMYGRLRGLPQ